MLICSNITYFDRTFRRFMELSWWSIDSDIRLYSLLKHVHHEFCIWVQIEVDRGSWIQFFAMRKTHIPVSFTFVPLDASGRLSHNPNRNGFLERTRSIDVNHNSSESLQTGPGLRGIETGKLTVFQTISACSRRRNTNSLFYILRLCCLRLKTFD